MTYFVTIVDKFNKKFPKAPAQPQFARLGARISTADSGSETVSVRWVHLSSKPHIDLPPPLPGDSISQSDPPETQLPHMWNQSAPVPLLKGYAEIYLSYSENAPVFEEMVSSKTINLINTYFVVPPIVALYCTPTKVLKKCRNKRRRKQLDIIQRAQSDTSAPSRFLPTSLHSVSQSIIHSHTDKISLYNNSDAA